MPLQNLIGLRQTDAVAVLLGREIELEDLVLNIGGNANALITDLSDYDIFVTLRQDG